MKAAIILEVVRRPFGSLGAAEEQEAMEGACSAAIERCRRSEVVQKVPRSD